VWLTPFVVLESDDVLSTTLQAEYSMKRKHFRNYKPIGKPACVCVNKEGKYMWESLPGVWALTESESVVIDRERGAGWRVQGEQIFTHLVNKEDSSVSDSKAVSLGSNQLVHTLQRHSCSLHNKTAAYKGMIIW